MSNYTIKYLKLCFLFVMLKVTQSAYKEDFLIVKSYDDNKYYCITNSTAALTWITNYTSFTSSNKYESESNPKSNPEFDFSNWEKRIQISKKFIFDRRWEKLQMYKTYGNNTKYLLVTSNIKDDDDVVIPFSVRIKFEAYIYLCNGEKIHESDCYCFGLGVSKGTLIFIRKCKKGQLTNENEEINNKNLKNVQVNPVKSEEWKHFKILKKKGKISINNTKNAELHSYIDDSPLNVSHMFVDSKNIIEGFWRIHEFEEFHTNKSNTTVLIKIQNKNKQLCISLVAKMCENCKLYLQIIESSKIEIIEPKEMKLKENSEWKKLIFSRDTLISEGTSLNLITCNENSDEADGKKMSFWRIKDVISCHEYWVIETNEKASCQLISSRNNTILDESQITEQITNRLCPENSIGQHCIPCSWFMNNDCGKLKVCEKNEKNVQCSCSAGYKSMDNRNCDTKCSDRKFGFGCNKSCSAFCIGCNSVNGTCINCTSTYMGQKCNRKYSLIITDVKYNSAEIQFSVFETNSNIVEKYVLQYKKKEDKFDEWTNGKTITEAGEKRIGILNNLEPDSLYFTRLVRVDSNEETALDTTSIYNFTTKCDAVTGESLDIETTNSTATIKIKEQKKKNSCKLIPSQISIRSTEAKNPEITAKGPVIKIMNLIPYQIYEIVINNITINTFKTKEGDIVQNLNAELKNSGKELTLSWEEPKRLYGKFMNYVIEHRITRFKNCLKKEEFSFTQTKSKNTSITLTNIIPYTEYEFLVYAENSIFQGSPVRVNKSIPKSDTIDNNEFPTIQVQNVMSRSIQLNITFDCTKQRGPVNATMVAKCCHKWCNKKHEIIIDKTQINLINLYPFSKYTINITICRNNNNSCKFLQNAPSFQTKPESPSTVNNITVYSKNDSSLSLRWEPPNPPSGVLEKFHIKYYESHQNTTIVNISYNNNCVLWPNYHCYTLRNLKGNTEYTIDIKAKNKSPDLLGQEKSIKAVTKIEPSDKPDNLTVSWNLDNDLIVRWNHPFITNGRILNFNISLQIIEPNRGKCNTFQLKTPKENDYKNNYSFTVKAENLNFSTEYSITISAFNGLNGKISFVRDFSPPEIPTFEKEPKFEKSNKNITKVMLSKIKNFNSNHTYKLFLLTMTEKAKNLYEPEELKEFQTNFGDKPQFITIIECNLCNNTQRNFVVEKMNFSMYDCNKTQKYNSLLKNKFNISNLKILIVHKYQNKSSFKLYSQINKQEKKLMQQSNLPENSTNLNYLTLLLLLIIPIGVIAYKNRHKLKKCKCRFISINRGYSNNQDSSNDQLLKEFSSKTIYSKLIKVSDFENYLKKCFENKELERQHALFPREQIKPCTFGLIPENKKKNRYTNLIPYDHTRVVLKKIKGDEFSDYINANYIDGYKVSKAYIATQGPKLSTLNDFWRMVWQENVHNIFMVANLVENGKKKVERYWPEINHTISFGEISITYITKKISTHLKHRLFEVTYNNQRRQIQHYQFLSWPDHGIPLYSESLVPFLEILQSISLNSTTPIVIHCSAGVGRTGTIILCDICLRMAKETKTVDILNTLQKLRDQRPSMVDNSIQYKLAHLVIHDYLFGLKSAIPCNELITRVDSIIGTDEIKNQIQQLEQRAWQDTAFKKSFNSNNQLLIVKEKNRFQDIIPDVQNGIILPCYPPSDDSSTYINAVQVDGYQAPAQFIATQQPKPNTISDFWRLIDERNVSVIISLNEINTFDKTCCEFWPNESQAQLKLLDYLTLKYVKTSSNNTHDVITINMTTQNEKTIEIIKFNNWKPKTNCPEDSKTVVSFYEQCSSFYGKSSPVVVTCFDGAQACGLFIALSFIIEKIKMEQICDVCQAVRIIRRSRPQFVRSKEQFEFLYQAAAAYVQEFEMYANFN